MMEFKDEIPETVQTFDVSEEILKGKERSDLVQPYYYIRFDNPATGYRGLRSAAYTYVVHVTEGKIDEVILFDRQKDPYQMNNIASAHPGLVRDFNRQLKAWLESTNDSFADFLTNND